jgi:hypothetical protein
MKQTIDLFECKFSYIDNPNQHFFKFYTPSSLKNFKHSPNNKIEQLLFHKSIATIYNQEFLNDDVLDFVLESLNLCINHRTEKHTVPTMIFGSTQDVTKIIPSQLNHPQVFKYLNMTSEHDNYDLIKSDSISSMKK